MVDDQQITIRRIKIAGVLLVFLVVLLLAIRWYVHYIDTGYLVIHSQSSSVITTEPYINDSYSNQTNSKNGVKSVVIKSGATERLKGGPYLVIVKSSSSNGSETDRVVNVKARTTRDYTINTSGITEMETVADETTHVIAASSSQLLYLDSGDQQLYSIGVNNQPSQLNSSVTFESIQWLNSTFGIGQDSTGALYAINNDQVSSISLPFKPSGEDVYAVAPNQTVYVSNGKSLYKGTVSSGFNRFYQTRSTLFSLAASNNQLAIVYSPGDGSSSFEGITLINSSGQTITKTVGAYTAVWSASGKYLAISDDQGSEILNNSLNLVAQLPTANVNNLTWQGDSTLYYSIDKNLWQYSLQSQQSEQIATDSYNGGAITDLTLSDNNSYIYAVIQTNNNYIIMRLGLEGQSASPAAQQLANYLPWISGFCSLKLINFTQPTVLIQSYITPVPDTCSQNATAILQTEGINTSSLSTQVSNLAIPSPSTQP